MYFTIKDRLYLESARFHVVGIVHLVSPSQQLLLGQLGWEKPHRFSPQKNCTHTHHIHTRMLIAPDAQKPEPRAKNRKMCALVQTHCSPVDSEYLLKGHADPPENFLLFLLTNCTEPDMMRYLKRTNQRHSAMAPFSGYSTTIVHNTPEKDFWFSHHTSHQLASFPCRSPCGKVGMRTEPKSKWRLNKWTHVFPNRCRDPNTASSCSEPNVISTWRTNQKAQQNKAHCVAGKNRSCHFIGFLATCCFVSHEKATGEDLHDKALGSMFSTINPWWTKRMIHNLSPWLVRRPSIGCREGSRTWTFVNAHRCGQLHDVPGSETCFDRLSQRHTREQNTREREPAKVWHPEMYSRDQNRDSCENRKCSLLVVFIVGVSVEHFSGINTHPKRTLQKLMTMRVTAHATRTPHTDQLYCA